MNFPDPIEIVAAFLLGAVLVLGASVTGQNERLCDALGGTYTPGEADQCGDGKWLNLVR